MIYLTHDITALYLSRAAVTDRLNM